ncbi:uncharacterized protein [Asterias amurensis]|uniref:uncharacterized protein n=1 Tax=Asterias amurensis TaxID=7602 RepID=UPI003AB301C6
MDENWGQLKGRPSTQQRALIPGKLQETSMGLVSRPLTSRWQLKIFNLWYLGLHWRSTTKLVQMGVEDQWICGLWTYLEVTKGPSLLCVLPANIEINDQWSGVNKVRCWQQRLSIG